MRCILKGHWWTPEAIYTVPICQPHDLPDEIITCAKRQCRRCDKIETMVLSRAWSDSAGTEVREDDKR